VLVGFGPVGVLGLVNGLVFAFGRIPHFVGRLGMMSIFSGPDCACSMAASSPIIHPPYRTLAIGRWIPRPPNIALVALLL
jgi:ribose transport system permease protein